MDSMTRSERASSTEFEELPLCPYARFTINSEKDGSREVKWPGGYRCYMVDTGFESGGSRHFVRPLHRCHNKNAPAGEDSYCHQCGRDGEDEDDLYCFCDECNRIFHRECAESATEIKHPYHPKHRLQLLWNSGRPHKLCYCCRREMGTSFYHCFACDFSVDTICAKRPAPLVIDHPKCHEHPLALFFPRQVSFSCNACALGNDGCSVYLCLQCDFIIHRDCISLPRVIKISRHPHRLSHTYDLPPGALSCGVCHLKMKKDCGGYSCTRDCSTYVAHAKCATRRDVWDGQELEGVPEDADVLRDVEPYEVIGDGIICHFGHRHHHLRLHEESRIYDESKFCQACTLPIHRDGRFYSCVQCDCILHERCANLPRRLQHPLHPHPLTLHADRTELFQCETCVRLCCGFMYACPEQGCDGFSLDTRCAASISEPFRFEGHPHSLYLSDVGKSPCMVCRRRISGLVYGGRTIGMLRCFEKGCLSKCVSLCFQCATLPYRIKYEHDDHLLALRCAEKEEASGLYWCEVCEGKVNPEVRFYTCDECCLTLHVTCVFGRDPYMKPGQTVSVHDRKIDILPNYNRSISRPICNTCGHRCQYRLVFNVHQSQGIFCSFRCLP
ncbi:PREDICTED: uncharacterized protein LOC104812543 [Tarenaya hassleriana]|uniref:uncharacterized protein LOC104812543 n=1 Tax=Tarenaya hassleriana TaxID=28532 RepID=UPI00053C2A0B|nr:PREDICTED: uncharacterized protein LOC104812543 [Tarenaya hassleriana]